MKKNTKIILTTFYFTNWDKNISILICQFVNTIYKNVNYCKLPVFSLRIQGRSMNKAVGK